MDERAGAATAPDVRAIADSALDAILGFLPNRHHATVRAGLPT